MDLQHTFAVPVGIDAAWAAFNDLEGIAPCFPGAVITSVDGDHFAGTAKVKLGPVSLTYTGKGQWVQRDPAAYRAVIEANGTDKRGNGTASATITAHLASESPELTRVVVDTDLRITGRPAQFGRGMIQDVGSKILDQFAACLSTRLGQGDEPAPASTPIPAPAPAPTPTPTRPAVPTSGPDEPVELDLGGVVGPVLLKRYGAAALAALVTAVLTWLLTRRRASGS